MSQAYLMQGQKIRIRSTTVLYRLIAGVASIYSRFKQLRIMQELVLL